METIASPFAGLSRKRLPGMHMITALEGGVPLTDALSGFFFMMLHDKYPHTCLIAQAESEVATATQEAVHGASNPEGMFLGSLFGGMASSQLAYEEWSYLPDEEAFLISVLANTAAEQTQRWISAGVESPYTIPLGPLVSRPEWAVLYHDREVQFRQEAVAYVEGLRREIDER